MNLTEIMAKLIIIAFIVSTVVQLTVAVLDYYYDKRFGLYEERKRSIWWYLRRPFWISLFQRRIR